MCLQDGPAGVRFAKKTSIGWQSSINTASTFNKTLMYLIGKAQGEENKQKGINTILGPSVNIQRSPQAGRIWEAFGEDPFYSGICATEIIKGIQDAGVIASIKHYIGNEQESYRSLSSSNIEQKTLMDIYIEPFYRAIKDAHVASVMCGYNAVNNTYNCENEFLLNDILRGILNFKGFVMTDWWLIRNNSTKPFNSGLEVNMPGGYGYGRQNMGRDKSHWSGFETFVKEGKISEERINEAATRIIASMFQLNQMENYPEINIIHNTITDKKITLQRKACNQIISLIKNCGILPINQDINSIAVIGNDAFPRDCINGDSDFQCKNSTNEVSNGHIPLGFGSGTTDFPYLITPIEAITNIANKKGMKINSSGKLIYTNEDRKGVEVHVSAEEDIDRAVEIANNSDIAIIFVAADSGESYIKVETSKGDRIDLNVWHKGNELIDAVSEVNINIIVVINAPAVVNMPWLNKVRAVVFSGFPGMESGNAIADILFGVVNPS